MSTRLHARRPAPALAPGHRSRPSAGGRVALTVVILAATYALLVAAAFYGLWVAP